MSMGPGPVDTTIQGQLQDIHRELAHVRDFLQGRPDMGWPGVLVRIQETEKRVDSLAEIQESFIRERDAAAKKLADEVAIEREHHSKREKARARVQAAVLTVFGTVLSGIMVQLFVLLTHSASGGHP